ncbi:hypothetical protein DPMN_156059 [Dreissena polymorpha]|uniref:Uncharacterized protein n=1 Tax=Dreissena polymorpha TaxID=45954 RepID=A0A9D4JBH4_DREPO|nr:hypothetical protein DPMN_156059 [Dreissena polymorpha]
MTIIKKTCRHQHPRLVDVPWGTVRIETSLFSTTLGNSQSSRTSGPLSSGFSSIPNRQNNSAFFRKGYW